MHGQKNDHPSRAGCPNSFFIRALIKLSVMSGRSHLDWRQKSSFWYARWRRPHYHEYQSSLFRSLVSSNIFTSRSFVPSGGIWSSLITLISCFHLIESRADWKIARWMSVWLAQWMDPAKGRPIRAILGQILWREDRNRAIRKKEAWMKAAKIESSFFSKMIWQYRRAEFENM